jgi:gamma-glutamyl-gamma-aminobutyrate hydrolase PuuD
MARVGVTRWEEIPGESIERYWQRLRDAGLEPVDLHGPDAADIDGLSALVLTGGADVDPARYGAERHEKTRPAPARDDFELALLSRALDRDMPVLAICRGHQLLNVCLGGSLLQHIESGEHSSDRSIEGLPSRSHMVDLANDSRLKAWFEGADRILVNSRHHQAVTADRIAADLVATGVTDDGLVEAVESSNHAWVVGVQWHPERDEPGLPGFAASGRRLFEELALALRGK